MSIGMSELKFGDLRAFLFRYVMPGLLSVGYLFTYIYIFQFPLLASITIVGVSLAPMLTVITFVGLFRIGLFLRTYPMDHWPYLRNKYDQYFRILHDHIISKLGNLRLKTDFNDLSKLSEVVYQGKDKLINYKKTRWLWQYIEFDRIDSNSVWFFEAAYMFWFNSATIVVIFLIAGLVTTIYNGVTGAFMPNPFFVILYVCVSIFLLYRFAKRGKESIILHVATAIVTINKLAEKIQNQ